MTVKELNGDEFEAFVKKGNCIVDFWAPWCGPCKVMMPNFEEASKKIKDVKFGKVNVDNEHDLAGKFGVMSVPTSVFFKDGEQVEMHSGAISVEDIEKLVTKNFS